MNIKRGFFAGLALTLLLCASVGLAGIGGTSHDLSGSGYGSTEICIYCHTPHNAKASPPAPLWNRAASLATYTPYSSNTLTATVGVPSAQSKACLSCHDGTVGLESFGSTTGTTNLITGAALVGSDLTNDHPVSFTYDAALATADGGLVSPASDSLVVTGIPLFGQNLECASCHSVHDDGNTKFLRVSNDASALCLKCHIK